MNFQRSVFLSFLLLFSALFVLVEFTNGKLWTNDFRVYYEATRDFFGGNNPYVSNYGLDTGFFKYPPFTLFLFWFPSLFSYGVAQMIHLLVLVASLLVSIPLLSQMSSSFFPSQTTKNRTWILYFSFASVATHVVREFHMGNVNLILLALAVSGLLFLKKQQEIWTVFAWGLMVILKPIVVLAFIPLVFFGKWRMSFLLAGLGVFFFLFPALFIGFKACFELWNNWFLAISEHGEYIVSENALKYYASYYFGFQSSWGLSLLFLFLLIGLMGYDRYKNGISFDRLYAWVAVFLAFTPNFFVTDTEHFLLSLPLFVLLIYSLLQEKNVYYWCVFALAFFGFSLNINDLWGHSISNVFDQIGVLGLGNLLFIALFLFVFLKPKKSLKE